MTQHLIFLIIYLLLQLFDKDNFINFLKKIFVFKNELNDKKNYDKWYNLKKILIIV